MIDNKVDFNDHVSKVCNKVCKKASEKIHALARISNYMSKDKLRIVMNAFIDSQFGYCPVVWMFHSRTLNNRINKLHERALRLVYKNEDCTFEELLEKDNSFTIHHRNLKLLATEMYQMKNNLSPDIMKHIFFQQNSGYHLRKQKLWETSNIRTVQWASETLSFRGPKTCDLVPQEIKESQSINEFKAKIKKLEANGMYMQIV